ncbi:unnamed protein product [Chilo suppressalis]|uniref:Uncharacterized protein n=1 Tax=Chilo suppressalis TaxID=168631 RepID=A0ABN8AUP6_CHISP|nr:unnamed protein product [Chilo suppressalis]
MEANLGAALFLGTEESPRYVSSPQRQASPFPHESTNRRFYRRNRDSKGEELFNGEVPGGTLSRRRRADDFTLDNNARNARHCLNNGAVNNGGQTSERECDSPPEPAPPEVPPRGPSLHVTLRHRPVPCEQPSEPDRLYLSEGSKAPIHYINPGTLHCLAHTVFLHWGDEVPQN